jgi:hypothetical protein
MKSRVRIKSRGKRKAGTSAKAKKAASRKSLKPRKPVKPPRAAVSKSDPLDSWIVAAAPKLGLKVEKSWMAAVRANLRVTLDQGVMVADFPLPDDAEPAPVFRA